MITEVSTIIRPTSLAALIASCSLMVGCGVKNPRLVSATAADRPADVRRTMSARRYEFDPPEIRVKQGQIVELHLVSNDGRHGFELKPFGIRADLPEDQPITVRFVANQPGEFEFRCIVFCGVGHHGMKGKLVVE